MKLAGQGENRHKASGYILNQGPGEGRSGKVYMKVLIIDDEEDIRSVAVLSLGVLGGIDVVEANTGQAGISLAVSEKPDVILLDMMMPDMDGPATLKALRESPVTRGIPVVFLTARAMKGEADRVKQMGAKGLITKPFDPTELATQVRKILETN